MAYKQILAALILIFILGLYSRESAPVVTVSEIKETPELYVGKSIEIYVGAIVDEIEPNRFCIKQYSDSLWVQGSISPEALGENVSFDGVFQADSTVRLNQIHIAKYRRVKMVVSLVGLGFVATLLFAALRWTKNGFEVIDA